MEFLLKATSTHGDILEAMKNPITGVGFLTQHQSLPSYTFISADAVSWLINHLENVADIDQAMEVLNSMHKEKLICHASFDFHKPFLFGFYLYHIVTNERGNLVSYQL